MHENTLFDFRNRHAAFSEAKPPSRSGSGLKCPLELLESPTWNSFSRRVRWAWLHSTSHAPVPSTPLQCHPTVPCSPAPAPSTHAPCHVVKAAHAAQPDIPMGLCDYISGPLYRPGVIYDYKHGSTSHWHSRGVYVTERLPLSSQPSANNWRTDQRDVISPSVIYLSAESPPSHRGTVPGPERELTSRAGVAAHMLIWRIQSACPQVFRF